MIVLMWTDLISDPADSTTYHDVVEKYWYETQRATNYNYRN